MFVHDLNQFVIVQLLEETLAVLSLGKLCKDHGYSYEWSQRSTATIDQKWEITLSARLSISYLLSFEGSSSSPTSLPQESLRPEADQASGNRAASSSFSDSVFERSDEQATKRLGQESLRSDKKDANDPLADLPFWFGDFTDDLEDTEMPAPAHISQDSDCGTSCEIGNKIEESQLLYTLSERPKVRRLLENQNHKGFLLKTHWRSSTADRKVW